LTFARGQLIVVMLPDRSMALILPLADKENAKASAAIDALKGQLTLLGGLSGKLFVETQPGDLVSVRGPALEAALPDGFQYTLTSDNLLVVLVGNKLAAFLPALKGDGSAIAKIADTLPGPKDKFLYAYADP